MIRETEKSDARHTEQACIIHRSVCSE